MLGVPRRELEAEAMAGNGIHHLRLLIANERRDRLELLARLVPTGPAVSIVDQK